MPFELGIDTFGDVTRNADGTPRHQAAVLRDVIDEAILADEVGVDFFGVGEHHRADFAISAPETVLAAIATRTTRIRLGSAVTVLSTDDPVRVFQRFSTVNALSNGRAEVILGRGSFTESFPLFGYALNEYEQLFEEKVNLFAAILEADRTGAPLEWEGRHRAPVPGMRVHPPIERKPLSVWVGVGGSPESVIRAARYAFPLTIAIIGGHPARFRHFVRLYHQALAQMGKPALPVGVHSPGHVADTDAEAREAMWGPYREMRATIGAERGWPPMTRREFDAEIEEGSLYVGAPDTVANKIVNTVRELGVQRFDFKYSAGPLSHDAMMRCIGLFGREVIPRVRAKLDAAPASVV